MDWLNNEGIWGKSGIGFWGMRVGKVVGGDMGAGVS